MFAEQHSLKKKNKPHPQTSCFNMVLHTRTSPSSLSLRRGAILLLEWFQEINSSLIPGTIPLSQLPRVQGVSPICHHFKTTQICKQLRKYAHTQQKKRGKIQSISFHSAVFLFSSLFCSAKNQNTKKKNNN